MICAFSASFRPLVRARRRIDAMQSYRVAVLRAHCAGTPSRIAMLKIELSNCTSL
jgi:hypothetical protein